MVVQLNHIIIWSKDRKLSARFLTTLFGLAEPTQFGPFDVVLLGNGVSLDFADAPRPIQSQHYAFLVSEPEFDAIFGRIQDLGLAYWADPARRHLAEINHADGGRGVYFSDPDDHLLEIITRPYGAG